MKTFTIYFELYGKKMKTEVMALSERSAQEIIKQKIVFHKIVEKKDAKNYSLSDAMKAFEDIFGKTKL